MANVLNNGNPQHELTKEDMSNGGKKSGEVRKKKAELKKTLEALLNSKNNNDKEYKELITLGLIANAIDKTKGGNPEAYKTIAKILGEMESEEENETPNVEINIVDNSKLEGVLYENQDKV